jgi:N-acyl-D-amino-acid deacylase
MEHSPPKHTSQIMETGLSRRSFLSTVVGGGAAAVLAGCAGTRIASRPGLDLLVRNGMVLDGTGVAERRLDVGIRDGMIVALGDLSSATAGRTIDAKGLKVVPGFIDIHSHTDLDLLKNPFAPSKVRQGVTTEVTGQDGESVAPIGGIGMPESLRAFEELYGFECPYRDMDGFFTYLASRGCAQNILSMVGLGTLRAVAVGYDDRPATQAEMAAMKDLAVRAIEQGCWGASTGLEYTPGSFATQSELAEVMSALPDKHRLYATHMRNEDNRVLEAITEAIGIAQASKARLQVSHLKAQNKTNWPKQELALRKLDEALAFGLDVHADRYPYVAFNTGLTNLFPLWARDGGTEKFLERLKDPSLAARLRNEVQRKVDGLGSWDSVLLSSVKVEEDKKYQGRTIQQIAHDESADPYEFVVALQLREKADVGMVGFGMDEAGTEMVLAWKNAMVASDAGPHFPGDGSWPHPRSYGTFPRAIAHYQRTRNITTLPDMVRKMTSLPADKLGLKTRGRIALNMAADLVLFDYATINDRSVFTDPHQFPEGIPFVMVNGVVVVDNGAQTTATPGVVIRS